MTSIVTGSGKRARNSRPKIFFSVIEVTRPFSTFLDNFSAIGSRVSEIYWIYRSLCEGYDSKKTGPEFNPEVISIFPCTSPRSGLRVNE